MDATGVSVNGALYDVSFQDGTCISLFGGCDEPSDFFIPDIATGEAANAALLEQVFIDTQAGQFDTIPGLTNGCGGATNDFVCNVHSPISDPPPTSSGFATSFARNRNLDNLDSSTGFAGWPTDVDFSPRDNLTFAVWSNPVPIPAAVWLFGSGLLGLIEIARKKKTG